MVALQVPSDVGKSSAVAHPIDGYFSETDILMHFDGPECDEDTVSVSSDVSMLSQWSFDIEDGHLPSPDIPPYGMYLPSAPSSSVQFAATPTLIPPLPSGYSFLDELNSSSDFGIPATGTVR